MVINQQSAATCQWIEGTKELMAKYSRHYSPFQMLFCTTVIRQLSYKMSVNHNYKSLHATSSFISWFQALFLKTSVCIQSPRQTQPGIPLWVGK